MVVLPTAWILWGLNKLLLKEHLEQHLEPSKSHNRVTVYTIYIYVCVCVCVCVYTYLCMWVINIENAFKVYDLRTQVFSKSM